MANLLLGVAATVGGTAMLAALQSNSNFSNASAMQNLRSTNPSTLLVPIQTLNFTFYKNTSSF